MKKQSSSFLQNQPYIKQSITEIRSCKGYYLDCSKRIFDKMSNYKTVIFNHTFYSVEGTVSDSRSPPRRPALLPRAVQ